MMDDLLREKIRQVTPEIPGTGFVPSVMFSIEQLAVTRQHRKTEPLISRKGWLIVVLIIGGLSILFAFTGTGKFSLAPLTGFINRFNTSYFSMFFSNFFLIALVTFVLFFLVQIYLISGYVERARRVEQ